MAEFSVSPNSSTMDVSPNGTGPHSLIPILKHTYFISGICVAVLSFIALTANGLLLLALWKDPNKRFRTPSTVFVVGLTVADFLTGILVGPIIAYARIVFSMSQTAASKFSLLQKVGQISSMLTMNASYIVLLFLTWNQFAAIRFPHKHRHSVTTRKVKICVVSSWTYALLFSLLLLWVQADVVFKIDFYAHNCSFLVLLTIAYTCLCVAFKRQTLRIGASTSIRLHVSQHQSTRRRNAEKQFTMVAMILVMFIIACTLPSTVLNLIYTYWKDRFNSPSGAISLAIAREVSGVFLFLKFSLDPFLYCWRLAAYRRALSTIMTCGKSRFMAEDISASRSVRSARQ